MLTIYKLRSMKFIRKRINLVNLLFCFGVLSLLIGFVLLTIFVTQRPATFLKKDGESKLNILNLKPITREPLKPLKPLEINLNDLLTPKSRLITKRLSKEAEPESEPDLEPSASELQLDLEPSASELQLDLEPSASELQPDLEPSASELQPDLEPSASELQLDLEPSTSELQLDLEPSASELQPDLEPSTSELQLDLEPSASELQPDLEPSASELQSKSLNPVLIPTVPEAFIQQDNPNFPEISPGLINFFNEEEIVPENVIGIPEGHKMPDIPAEIHNQEQGQEEEERPFPDMILEDPLGESIVEEQKQEEEERPFPDMILEDPLGESIVEEQLLESFDPVLEQFPEAEAVETPETSFIPTDDESDFPEASPAVEAEIEAETELPEILTPIETTTEELTTTEVTTTPETTTWSEELPTSTPQSDFYFEESESTSTVAPSVPSTTIQAPTKIFPRSLTSKKELVSALKALSDAEIEELSNFLKVEGQKVLKSLEADNLIQIVTEKPSIKVSGKVKPSKGSISTAIKDLEKKIAKLAKTPKTTLLDEAKNLPEENKVSPNNPQKRAALPLLHTKFPEKFGHLAPPKKPFLDLNALKLPTLAPWTTMAPPTPTPSAPFPEEEESENEIESKPAKRDIIDILLGDEKLLDLRDPAVKTPKKYKPRIRQTSEILGPARIDRPSWLDRLENATSAERAERFSKWMRRVMGAVSIMSQIDSYLTQRTRANIKKMNSLFDVEAEEYERRRRRNTKKHVPENVF